MTCPLTGAVDASSSIAISADSLEECTAIVADAEIAPIGPLPSISDECGIDDYFIGDLLYIADDAPPVL